MCRFSSKGARWTRWRDTSIFGVTSPIRGSRYRLQLDQTLGDLNYGSALADYRTYVMLGDGETAEGSDHYRVLFLIGILLFTITFIVNFTADMIVRGIRSSK